MTDLSKMTRLNQRVDLELRPGIRTHDDNYIRKIQVLVDCGVDVSQVRVMHDDWCAWYNNNDVPCNCDPDIHDLVTGAILLPR